MVRIFFNEIRPFPPVPPDDRIETETFLQCAREFATLFDLFGFVFKASKHDVLGNITKIHTRYQEDPAKFRTLVDIMRHEKETKLCDRDPSASVGLLWLIRGLTLLCEFLMAMVKEYRDNMEAGAGATAALPEDLAHIYVDIYKRVLMPYHGWFASTAFKMGSKAMPHRSVLTRRIAHDPAGGLTLEVETKVVTSVEAYCTTLGDNVATVTRLLHTHGLWREEKCA